jgi:hypothetical protein
MKLKTLTKFPGIKEYNNGQIFERNVRVPTTHTNGPLCLYLLSCDWLKVYYVTSSRTWRYPCVCQ